MSKVSMCSKGGLLLGAALVSILLVAFSAQSLQAPEEDSGGRWIETAVQDCEPGHICVVWELSNRKLSGDPPCCVRDYLVSSGNYGACSSYFRHGHNQ